MAKENTVTPRIPKTLLAAASSYAGMGPYVASIVNSFSPTDPVRFLLIEREDRYFSKNIREDLKPLCRIYSTPKPNKLRTLLYLLRPSFRFKKQLLSFCNKENIEAIHILNSLFDPGFLKKLSKQYKLLETVHDLHSHEQKKAWYKELRMNILEERSRNEIAAAPNLYTNSLSQHQEIKKLFPGRPAYFSHFPTLVTDEIKKGTAIPPEIKSIKDYILFFGRIEAYKGVESLAKAFLEANLDPAVKLVIAGKGSASLPSDPRIIFINRYIGDDEVAALYRNAAVAVYPYISATQSGVLSVAAWFGTPVIASSVNFFKEELGDSYPWLFTPGDTEELTALLSKYFSITHRENLQKEAEEFYRKAYASDKTRDDLLHIYSRL